MSRRKIVSSPSAKDLISWSPKLEVWTRFAAQSFAIYRGANIALGYPIHISGAARDLADRSRMEAALMTVTRLSALFDSDPTTISFQGVNRGLKSDTVRAELAEIYGSDRPAYLSGDRDHECLVFQEEFLSSYASVSWDAYSRLQVFRNREIAHLTPEETSKRITHGELEDFANLAFSLQRATSLFTHGRNTNLRETCDEIAETYKEVWIKAFRTP